ncbi:MAG: hypothetical protein M5U07_15670 [Xanthobacteraceae bacterium]|nr:hypothetical protein [Xanthobacteraceae bacterium]
MAITTYAELQAAVASWLARDDLAAHIPDFIVLFEASACRRLRVRPAERAATVAPANGEAALPEDFLGVRRLTRNGASVDLAYVHPSALPAPAPGAPAVYTIEGGTLRVRPVDVAELTLVYRARTPGVASALNWLFTHHPDAYLFGALAEAHLFDKDPESAAIWKARAEQVLNEIREVDFHYRGAMRVRVGGPTP